MKHALTSTLVLLMCFSAKGQEALNFPEYQQSPIINPDSTVTISIKAPQAKTVRVDGLGSSSIELHKSVSEPGLWSVNISLTPDLYTYYFDVDGVRTLDPANPYTARDISALFNILIIPGGNANYFMSRDVPHGNIRKEWYHSKKREADRRMTIYTPPGYDSRQDKRYPVFYLLHGMGGDEDAWNDLGRASIILDNMISEGKIEPMIVVMPNGNALMKAAPGFTSEGMYVPRGEYSVAPQGAFEESFPEIVEYIDTHYKTISDKKYRAIAGLSMGGGHAWRISMNYPEMFDYVGLFSAAIRMNGTRLDPIDDTLDFPLLNQFADAPQLYWIGIGKDDFLFENNVTYRQLLDRLGIQYQYNESQGGHTWKNWRNYLIEFLPALFKN